jgi:Neutral/alkaline non-lysosomal ceramidase, N-terminal
MRLLLLGVASLLALPAFLHADEPARFKAGVATKVITPAAPMWMSGYANRDHPAEGKVHDLYAKALALEDGAGTRLTLLTTDLVGLPRGLSKAVAEDVERRTGLPRANLMLTASHTHCGPVLRESLIDMYDMPPGEAAKIKPYTEQLRGWLVEVMTAALADLKPARLTVGRGLGDFAVNRREPTPKGVINRRYPSGPVDHDVPVLRVETPDGKLRAVAFGYACHNTTLSFYRWCGDYAGFAQAELEKRHPGATALFWIGCAADANPLPRGTVELCRHYGHDLAEVVDRVLNKPMAHIQGTFAARYSTVSLPFDTIPPREKFAADTLSKNTATRKRAERLLRVLDAGGTIDDHYRDYPVQVWRLGDGSLWIALGGEVVVDYALRLKKEYAGDRPVWVTGYANDVMAYVPSLRVLQEGGYEGDTSMVPYGMPTKWAPPIEERIVGKVHELVGDLSAARR